MTYRGAKIIRFKQPIVEFKWKGVVRLKSGEEITIVDKHLRPLSKQLDFIIDYVR